MDGRTTFPPPKAEIERAEKRPESWMKVLITV
jgi:hypothetical protein